MDELHATCPFCAHERPAVTVDIVMLASPERRTPDRAVFVCAGCHRTVSISVDGETAGMLRRLGAREGHAGPRSPATRHADAPPLTLDDLLDLHLLLQRDDWFDRLLATV